MKRSVTVARRFAFRAIILSCALFAPAAAIAQEAGGEEQAIEVLRTGIPHDALFALDMSGESGLAVGAFGLMLETTDGGSTWNALQPKTLLALLGVARSGDKMIVVGQRGLVMTRSGDAEWEVVESDMDQRLMDVDLHESGFAVTIGEFGFVGRSTDAGASWEPVVLDWAEYNDEGYEPHLYDAVIRADGTALITGEFGLILRSRDRGATWEAVHRGEQSVFALSFAGDNPDIGFAVGQEGLILKTTDGGSTWESLDSGTNANLLGVWTGNGEVVIPGIRELLRSSNDGATFRSTGDLQVIRTWFQGVDAGVTETKAGEKGFLRQQFVYIAGHTGTIARVLE